MSDLRDHSHDYLALRRALGYKLTGEGRLLADLVAFLADAGASTITTALAVAWTTKVTGSAAYLARRMRVAALLRSIPPRPRPQLRDPTG